ncbi:phosphotransferase [Erythrobacter sp. YJ-T3-07]|uniref:aminoglycoside phosphotransferase family protein n=1 Tax=Erythrobacter sp. YJ-T3-07 TaxID=2793063 RepID=UPI0018D3D172|nr:phosphotransferase [Erythrobacter sp. YJ-T3-07]MBH1944188.1 phosphotransferase [Erythrobacter sp. YJ-T3-07]
MTTLPDGIHDFLGAAGWAGAQIAPLTGDASFRRYFRLHHEGKSAMLMHAPPPEEPREFLHVGRWLLDQQIRAPQIYAEDLDNGWVLIEDFGDARMRDWLDENPAAEDEAYAAAIDTLADLHRKPAGPFPPYDEETYLREAQLFTQWYCPALGLEVDSDGFDAAWREVLAPLAANQQPGVTVLRDYHAENIMLLAPDSGAGSQGVIDFQDALVGHPAYDLVSLLQDARRDVTPELEARMLARYRECTDCGDEFDADYARLGAQRNTKIVGIFARLNERDGKPRYLALIPRVWEALERDLAHPALAPVAQWFETNIPADLRARNGALEA